jgi:hypothetical protein
VPRMNPHPQPRISLLFRRAHWFCVSHPSERSMVVRFRLSHAPPHAPSLCGPLLKPKHPDRNGKLANDQDRLIQTNPIVPPGAASFKSLYLKRPSTAPQLPASAHGRFRYSTKTSGPEDSPGFP